MCDGDPPEFYEEHIRRARKRHICCECRGRIGTGEQYHYAAGKWHGDFDSFATCLPCHGLRQRTSGGDCWNFGELADVLYQDRDEPENAAWLERYLENQKQRQRERECVQ